MKVRDNDLIAPGISKRVWYVLQLLEHREQQRQEQELNVPGALPFEYNENIERFLVSQTWAIETDIQLQTQLFRINSIMDQGEINAGIDEIERVGEGIDPPVNQGISKQHLKDRPVVPKELLTASTESLILCNILNRIAVKHAEYAEVAKKRNFLFKPNKQRRKTVAFITEMVEKIQALPLDDKAKLSLTIELIEKNRNSVQQYQKKHDFLSSWHLRGLFKNRSESKLVSLYDDILNEFKAAEDRYDLDLSGEGQQKQFMEIFPEYEETLPNKNFKF